MISHGIIYDEWIHLFLGGALISLSLFLLFIYLLFFSFSFSVNTIQKDLVVPQLKRLYTAAVELYECVTLCEHERLLVSRFHERQFLLIREKRKSVVGEVGASFIITRQCEEIG